MRCGSRCWVLLLGVLVIALPAGSTETEQEGAEQEGSLVLEKVFDAHGGRDRIEQLRSIRYRVLIHQPAAEQAPPIPGEITMVYPDKLQLATFSEHGTVRRVVNGNRAVIRLADGDRPMPPQLLEAYQAVFCRDLFTMAQRTDEYQVRLVDDGGGVGQLELAVTGPCGPFGLLIAEETYLPVMITYQEPGADGPVDVVEKVSEYHEVDGITMYYRSQRLGNGQEQNTFLVEEMEINPDVDLEIFRIEQQEASE